MSRRSEVTLSLLFLFLLLLPGLSSLGQSEDAWQEWRGSNEHLGVAEGGLPDEGVLRWSYRTGDQVQSSAVFYQGTLLIGSDDAWLYCLDARTGERVWRFKTGGSVQSTPLILDDKAFFGATDGFFSCLELPDPSLENPEPAELWSYDCGQPIVSSAHLAGDSLLLGCQDGSLYSLDIDGDLNWKREVGWELWATPLVDEVGGKVYIGAINGSFACLGLDSGEPLWWLDNPGDSEIYSSCCLHNGTVYLTTGFGQELLAINATDGSVQWRFNAGFDCYSTPSVKDGRVFFTSFEYIWCLPTQDPDGNGNLTADEVLWQTPHHDEQGGSSPLLAGVQLFVGSDDHYLYCLDQEDGTILWTFPTEGYVYSSPSLYDKAVYFGSNDGTVYCVGNRPPRLQVSLELEKPEIGDGERLPMIITVKDPNGSKLRDASVDIVLSAGSFELEEGNQRGAKTDAQGELMIVFLPPAVSSRSTLEIRVTAEKQGLEPGSAVALLVVTPGGGSGDGTEDVVNEAEARRPYYWLLGLIIAGDLALVGVIVNQKDQEKGGKIP